MEQLDIQNNIIKEPKEMLDQDDLKALVDYFRLLLDIDLGQKGESDDESNNRSASSSD